MAQSLRRIVPGPHDASRVPPSAQLATGNGRVAPGLRTLAPQTTSG
jgi:hypothetical protein